MTGIGHLEMQAVAFGSAEDYLIERERSIYKLLCTESFIDIVNPDFRHNSENVKYFCLEMLF